MLRSVGDHHEVPALRVRAGRCLERDLDAALKDGARDGTRGVETASHDPGGGEVLAHRLWAMADALARRARGKHPRQSRKAVPLQDRKARSHIDGVSPSLGGRSSGRAAKVAPFSRAAATSLRRTSGRQRIDDAGACGAEPPSWPRQFTCCAKARGCEMGSDVLPSARETWAHVGSPTNTAGYG